MTRFGYSRRLIWVLVLFTVLSLTSSAVYSEKVTSGEEGVLRATLDNGLRVVIVRNTLAPVVATVVNYLVGSNETPEGFPGMAHAQEHMMFRGSPGLSGDQLANIIALMGGIFNADTQQTVTQYFLVAPAENLDVALRIEAIRMRGVLDTERLWKEERGAIEQEVQQDLSDPEYVFYTKLLASMFKGTPYAYTPLGTISSFDKTTGAMLKKFYDTWYAPNNAILVIVGNVNPPEALADVRRHFSTILSKKIPQRRSIRPEPIKAEAINLKTDQSYGLAVVSFRMPGYGRPDYPACEVLSDVLSNPRSELYALVPRGKALYAGFALSPLPGEGLGYIMAAFPKGDDPAALIQEIKGILSRARQNGFDPDLIEAAKRTRVTKSEIKKNSIYGLADAWSKALALEGVQSPEETTAAIRKVTAADVKRVVVSYLNPDQAIVAILTPESSGKAMSSKASPSVESFTPKQTKPVKLPEWAQNALNRLSIPPSTVNPVVGTLPNGLKLIIQPAFVSKVISVYGHIKSNADLEAPAGQEGVDDVLEQLFPYGTISLDRITFQKALDDIGAQESAGTQFSLQVLVPQFDKGVELLANNVLHPALPEEAFQVVRKQVSAIAAGELQSPDNIADHALKTALYPKGDPACRQATPVSVSSLSIENVKDYHRKVFRPDLTTIVVIGSVAPEEVRKTIEKHFGSWKATGPKPETDLPPTPPNKASATAIPDNSRVQVKVTLAQTLGLNRSHSDYYALELGNHILGGAFYATRLYRDLRESAGLVYYVSSSFDVGKTRSVYRVEYACDPINVFKARRIIEENLRELQTRDVGPAELRQAKALILREMPLAESSITAIAHGLIYRSTYDLPLDEPTVAARRYLNMTPEQVRAAYLKWVRPADLAQVTEGPVPK